MWRALIGLLFLLLPGTTTGKTLEEIAGRLGAADFATLETLIGEIAATGDERALPLLDALGAGELQVYRDGRLLRTERDGRATLGFDFFTNEPLGQLGRRDAERIRVNNAVRRAVRVAVGRLTIGHPDPVRRRDSAVSIFRSRDLDKLDLVRLALTTETDARVRTALERAEASLVLASDAPQPERLAALSQLGRDATRDLLPLVLATEADADPTVAEAAAALRTRIERVQATWNVARNVWFGISLGSVLMLAAIGLAISFGVMGVINMAHGELVMVGAYTAFFVQALLRTHAPGLLDWSLLIALPAAFAVSGLIGVAIERGICRFLYGRALETLLATWGVSLILQQTVRSLFGPTNQMVSNPSWMAGSFEVGQLTITYGRFWIVIFSLLVFAGLLLLLRRTPMGLQMRAVTQNRRMASAMGVRTGWVDAMTFGLGAGIAGIAGVALSQIDNVSPNLGQGYIVDSFMVVVFGGVGNLWGTMAAAFTLGIANKFMEPYVGAVLAKVLVLVFIILFIQKRPRGLFALKGRAVEA